MPIIDLELLIDTDEPPLTRTTITRLADVLGGVLDSQPGGTWLKVHYLNRADYAENDVQLSATTKPTMVRILRADLPSPAARRTEAAAIANAVASALNRPVENTHVLYEPAGRGRIAFGGTLVE